MNAKIFLQVKYLVKIKDIARIIMAYVIDIPFTYACEMNYLPIIQVFYDSYSSNHVDGLLATCRGGAVEAFTFICNNLTKKEISRFRRRFKEFIDAVITYSDNLEIFLYLQALAVRMNIKCKVDIKDIIESSPVNICRYLHNEQNQKFGHKKNSALKFAIVNNNIEMVKFMLVLNTKITKQHLLWAAGKASIDIFKLIDTAPVDLSDNDNIMLRIKIFDTAISACNYEVVKYLNYYPTPKWYAGYKHVLVKSVIRTNNIELFTLILFKNNNNLHNYLTIAIKYDSMNIMDHILNLMGYFKKK